MYYSTKLTFCTYSSLLRINKLKMPSAHISGITHVIFNEK